jgi:hypothetical protein
MGMRRKLRFLLALIALAMAAVVTPGFADEQRCPGAWVMEYYPYTCGHTGHGSCANRTCEYDCAGSTVVHPTACDALPCEGEDCN